MSLSDNSFLQDVEKEVRSVVRNSGAVGAIVHLGQVLDELVKEVTGAIGSDQTATPSTDTTTSATPSSTTPLTPTNVFTGMNAGNPPNG